LSYAQGFLDAILIIKHYLETCKSLEELRERIDELEVAIAEKKLEKIKAELGLFRL